MAQACDEAVDHLIDMMAGTGPAQLVAHAHGCPVCQRRMQDMRTVTAAVQALPRIALPAGFEAKLTQELARQALAPALEAGDGAANSAQESARHASASAQEPPAGAVASTSRPKPQAASSIRDSKRRARGAKPKLSQAWRTPWVQTLAGGMAVAAVVFAVVLLRAPAEAHVVMGLAQRVEVDIAVDSAAKLAAADMRIMLPVGVSVASGDPALDGAQSLQWSAPLDAGVNHFAVLLKPDSVGAHRVHVQISDGINSADMDVVVQVQPEGHAANTRTRALPVLALREARGER